MIPAQTRVSSREHLQRFVKCLVHVLLAMVCLSDLAAQVTTRNGVQYPSERLFNTDMSAHRRSGVRPDTIQYAPLRVLKDDYVVNEGCGDYGANRRLIGIESGDDGGYLCAWIDDRTGFREIRAQVFGPEGRKRGNILELSGVFDPWNCDPFVLFNPISREYLVLWAQTGYDIRIQRVSMYGELLGGNVVVTQSYTTNVNNPSATTDDAGNVLVAWTADEYCCLTERPVFRVLNKDLLPLTSERAVPDSATAQISSSGLGDIIAGDSSGRAAVVWSAHFGGRSRIFLAQVGASVASPTPILVSASADTNNHYFPTIAGTRSGVSLIMWHSDVGIQGRLFKCDSGFVTPPFTIVPLPGLYYYATYDATVNPQGNFVLAWTANTEAAMVISPDGTTILPAQPLSYPSAGRWSYHTRVAVSSSGRTYLGLNIQRRSQVDVAIQEVNGTFQPIGLSKRTVDRDCTAWQTNPVVCLSSSGRSLVVWEDNRRGYQDLYAQVLDASTSPVFTNVVINDTSSVEPAGSATVAPTADGGFVVSYITGPYYTPTLLLQRLSSAGSRPGPAKLVRVEPGVYDLRHTVASNGSGNIFSCWYASYPTFLRTQIFSPSLTELDTAKTLLDDAGSTVRKRILFVSANKAFDIVVVWLDYDSRNYVYDRVMKAIVYDSRGVAISDTIIVDTLSADIGPRYGDCRIDDERNIAVVWSEESWGWSTVKAVRRYWVDGSTHRSEIDADGDRNLPSIVTFGQMRLFVAWHSAPFVNGMIFDDHSGTRRPCRLGTVPPVAWDVYHRVFSADAGTVAVTMAYQSVLDPSNGFDISVRGVLLTDDQFTMESSMAERMISAYPNPSTGRVTLRYFSLFPSPLSVTVYNILGQQVLRQDVSPKGPGDYEITIETGKLPTGVYFVQSVGIGVNRRRILIVR